MKISVIIPVYNVKAYLNRCLRSVLGQSYRDLEVILVDDGSTDTSPEICQGWAKADSRVRFFQKENGGPSKARNFGLQKATGEYVHFMDSDDWIEPDTYQHCMELIDAYKRPDLTRFGFVVTKSERRLTQNEERIRVLNKRGMFEYFFRIHGEASNYSICDKLIRREILKGFAFRETMFEDVEACYEFYSRASSMVETTLVFYNYFKNPSSITNSKVKAKDLDLIAVWNRLVNRTEVEHPEFVSYALWNRKRAAFTILSKMFLKGADEKSVELARMKPILKAEVRKNFFSLFFGKMPISRQVLLILVAL